MLSEEKKELILSYLPLVKSIAYKVHRHLPSSVDINDLIGYGVLALIESLPKLDKNKNPTAYLKLRIKGAMYDYLRQLDFASRGIRHREKSLREAFDRFRLEREKEPTDEELAEFMGEDLEKLREDLKAVTFSYLLSLDELFQEGRSYEELFESSIENPEEAVIREDIRRRLIESIERLDQREKLVLQLLYYEELPLREVSKIMNLSMARVSQIKSSAIEKLKKFLSDLR
ncbi:MAG: FliA/WhiG family RNA polymerase sigma factor [Acidobacteria bacterium]|jgi:RNA polymerase sigma factor for flagellar operon FliA|nr:MAG: FliA/WhiG family RNA polymerase sigma factor [Acidobacteriota bacterium]